MTASFADQEIWHVLVASDDMKRMNVDQLDDAFRLDIVDASTMVWKNGMDKWRRLGSLAGIDDEPETIARPLGPPAPPPPPRPRTAQRAALPVNPFQATVNPFASTTPAGVFDVPRLMAPVYTPPIAPPDPYVLPKRRVSVPSEVDFRRSSGVHWGRWLFAFVLITGGVLGAYRQNLLREGARRLGIEGRYLAGEHRVTALVSAKAPPQVKNVLTRLALLPGPNALPTPVARPAAPVVAAPAAAPETVKASTSTAPGTDSDVKTVSLDQLPTEAAAPAAETAPATRSAPVARSAPATRSAPVAKAEPKAAPRKEKAEAETAPVEKPKPAPKAPPAAMNDTPLKAAIWAAMQKDVKK